MISREEAYRYLEEYDRPSNTINKIYDSIGSCSECKHFSVIEPENFLNCSELGCEVPSIKHFCDEFERKGDK